MQNRNETPDPRPSAPRPPRRRRAAHLARVTGVIAVAALLILGLDAGMLRQAWSRPMPLKHKIVTVVTALPALASTPIVLTGPQTPNEVSQVTFSSGSTYVGGPILATADVAQSVNLTLPTGATAQPAGDQVAIGPVFVYPGGLAWRSAPGSAATVFDLSTGWNGYASWFLSFDKPGTFNIPVAIGTSVSTATIHVLPLPSGATISTHATPAQHPELQISNPASAPIRVEGSGLPSVLTPGQSLTITPPSTYQVLAPPTQGTSNEMFQFEIRHYHGSVSYSGTVTTHHRIAYRPHRGPFTLPLWLRLALVLAALLLVASGVLGLTGGRGGRGGKGKGTAGDWRDGD